MEITRITEENITFFSEMLFELQGMQDSNLLLLGAIDNKVACGIAAIQLYETNAQLLSIYICPEYRRRGYATELMMTFFRLAEGTPVKSICADLIEGDESGLKTFLKTLQFDFFSKTNCFQFTLGDARNSKVLRKFFSSLKISDKVKSLKGLQGVKEKILEETLFEAGYPIREIKTGSYSEELSYVNLKDQRKLNCCMLCSDKQDTIQIDFLLMDTPDILPMLQLLKSFLQDMADRPDTLRIIFLGANETASKLAEKLLDKKILPCNELIYSVRII